MVKMILTALASCVLTAVLVILFYYDRKGTELEITQLYLYPVKGLRGCTLERARIGPYGLIGDRTFSLQKVHHDAHDKSLIKYETMLIGYALELSLFTTSVTDSGNPESPDKLEVNVTWHGKDTEFGKGKTLEGTEEILRFPLQPSTDGCLEYEATLHSSPTKAYDMGDKAADWFSARLGYEVRLAYIGDGSRAVLGSMAPNSKAGLRRARFMRRLRALIGLGVYQAERLAFNDIAHYLVVTEESNSQVSSDLADGFQMDVRKFRPNIVVKGAAAPYVEDLWAEITFNHGILMALTANCYRCQSITVDYDTGKAATDDRGTVWKKLNKYRRVDAGAKYSPVFGRYGYCFGDSVGKHLYIGQKGQVTGMNIKTTTFDWPHLTNFGVSLTKK